jgi:hypothetical protein
LAIGESHVALQLTCGGGLAALRMLESALEMEGGRRILHADLVAREARITLGQLPAELRDMAHRIRIFGPRDLAQQLADEMELRLEPMGFKVEVVSRYAAEDLGVQAPADAPVSPAFSLAAEQLTDRKPLLEFLPPRISAWQQAAARYSSGRFRMAGAAVGAIGLLVAALFMFQEWQLSALQSQWKSISPRVSNLEKVQGQIRQFRGWYDESVRGLRILRQLTEAFPERGDVSAKSVEIRDLTTVTCAGVARDEQSLRRTIKQLNSFTNNVAGLKMDRISGKSPLQFTFDFRWVEGGAN